MKRYYQVYFAGIFLLLALFSLLTFVVPGKEYSANENRFLEAFPSFSFEKVLSGEYQEKLQESVSDRFIGRDFWMESATFAKKATGYKEMDGVYLGKDSYYIAKTTNSDIDQMQYLKNLRYLEYFAGKAGKTTDVLLIPSAGTILKEKLPKGAPFYDSAAMYKEAGAVLAKAKLLDVREEIRQYGKQSQVYFRTDHHWTLNGAYAAYAQYCERKKRVKHSFGYFGVEKVSDDFLGSMYSKVLDFAAQKDSLYAAKNLPQAEVVCDGQKEEGVYAREKLNEKDKYAYFFGGNFARVDITRNAKKKKLLVIKDSFANSFVPFLLEQYSDIVMIDLRYYRESVGNLLEAEKFDEVLVLYEMSNFANDTNLYKLTK